MSGSVLPTVTVHYSTIDYSSVTVQYSAVQCSTGAVQVKSRWIHLKPRWFHLRARQDPTRLYGVAEQVMWERVKELDVTIHNYRLLLVAVVLIRSHYGMSYNKLWLEANFERICYWGWISWHNKAIMWIVSYGLGQGVSPLLYPCMNLVSPRQMDWDH